MLFYSGVSWRFQSLLQVRIFENLQDFVESLCDFAPIGQVDRKAPILIRTGEHMAVGEKDVCRSLSVMCARENPVRSNLVRTKEYRVDGESPNGSPISVRTQSIE